MNSPHRVFDWIFLSLPIAAVLSGVLIFVIRWARSRRNTPQDPESLLLGAVSKSLMERGELAASLGELRTVHERLLDALPFGLLWVDQKQRVAALNRVGVEMLKVTRGVMGLEAAFVLEPYPWIREALAQQPGPSFRCDGVLTDGKVRRWRLRRIEAPDKIGALLQFEDITEMELEERRRALRERFAELGEMTAGVAHQLKNGLAVLQGHGQLLKRQGHVESGDALLLETDELGRVVQRFLQWAKPLEPKLQSLKLEEVAAQVVEEIRRRPPSLGRLLSVEGQGSAQGDPMLLHQALLNLVENACQATPSGGRVRLLAYDGLLEIFDDGPGLGEETAQQMLRPFESGRPDGTGLGLPLALKWINAQGADLSFEKRMEGGTCVRIRW